MLELSGLIYYLKFKFVNLGAWMEFLPLLISMIPTVVLLVLVGAFRFSSQMLVVLWTGVAFGVVACVPVYFMETVIEGAGDQLSGLYEKAFVQQVLGAAVSEELWIFFGFLLTYKLFQSIRIQTEADVVATAVAVAIGFTTIENITAVIASETPMSASLNRLLSIVAGHASLQLVMGYFAAKCLLGGRNRLLFGLLMLAVPIGIHGWGDFTESIFQAVDADSPQSKQFFSAWIFGIFAYLAGAAIVLFKLRETVSAGTFDAVSNPSDLADSDTDS